MVQATNCVIINLCATQVSFSPYFVAVVYVHALGPVIHKKTQLDLFYYQEITHQMFKFLLFLYLQKLGLFPQWDFLLHYDIPTGIKSIWRCLAEHLTSTFFSVRDSL